MIINTSKASLLCASRLPGGIQYLKKYTGKLPQTFIFLEVNEFKLIKIALRGKFTVAIGLQIIGKHTRK